MTRDEQIRMLLHPEKYTDEQLDQMLNETNIPVPDAEEEWEKLQTPPLTPPLEGRGMATRRWLRVAAMFIGVLMLSGITYAAIQLISNSTKTEEEPQTEAVVQANAQPTDIISTATDEPTDSVRIFENAELMTMLTEMAAYYHCEVSYQREETKHVRLYFTWDKASKIDDVVATFNKFDRIHITQEDRKLIVE
jgi:hypothetical protein